MSLQRIFFVSFSSPKMPNDWSRATTTKCNVFNRKGRLLATRVKEGSEMVAESAGWPPQGEMRGGGGARGGGTPLLCCVCVSVLIR